MNGELRYLVLANGFWAVSKQMFSGRQVDPDAGTEKMSDYIIAVKGLPDELFLPEEIRRHRVYHCNQCDRPISEGEMEGKFGCFAHDKRFSEQVRIIWRSDAFEAYSIPKIKWLKPAFRLWMNNQQGLEKFRQIWRYVDKYYPTSKPVPLPVLVGNRMQWLIDESEVPVIDLTDYLPKEEAHDEEEDKEEEKKEVVKPAEFKCDLCGRAFKTNKALLLHVRIKHASKKVST